MTKQGLFIFLGFILGLVLQGKPFSDMDHLRLYYSPTCPYSKKIWPLWEEVLNQEGLTYASWNCLTVSCDYPTPTLFLFKEGNLVDVHVGFSSIQTFLIPLS